MDYKILNTINSPNDVKKLTKNELDLLCDEIRNCLVETVSANGGHLSSNLGTVELTVALHRIFNSPSDAILFDVGHQSYTHKLLTGRFKQFSTLRKEGGLSGFMNPNESEHDYYVSGHSSNCISAAYGIYKAKNLKGEDTTAVAVVGDGAMTGGMVYEALNNIGADNSKFIVILNDNKMSISENVGAIARHLNKIRLKSSYHKFKYRFSRFLNGIPLIGKGLYKFFYKLKIVLKNVVYHNNIFAGLGFNYLGPVNGHDISALENVLSIAKNQDKPTLVHVITIKGKGYCFAETDPGIYHGVSNFNYEEGLPVQNKTSCSSVAANQLCELAEKDDKVCAITAAMTFGTGLVDFEKQYKKRFFDVGIAEEHAVTFAAGLAKGGMKPYFVVYSSFLQRSYDQILHDIGISRLPVKLLIDRAGFVGEDGCTHQGLFDVAFLSTVPNMTIYSPASYSELIGDIKLANSYMTPIAVRYPRGSLENSVFEFSGNDFDLFSANSKNVALSYGRISDNVYKASVLNKTADFIKLNKIYPLEDNLINELSKYDNIYIFEEAVKSGSVGEKIISKLSNLNYMGKIKQVAVNDEYVNAASVNKQLKLYNLDVQGIENTIRGN